MSLLMIPLAMFFVAVMIWAGCQLYRMSDRHPPSAWNQQRFLPDVRPVRGNGWPARAGVDIPQ